MSGLSSIRFAVLALLALPGGVAGQAITLPLRGTGELDLPSGIQTVSRGSVLLRAGDSAVHIVVLDAGTPRTVVKGRWRMADQRSAELDVDFVLESNQASGGGTIRFRPDGSVDDIDVSGKADGEPFTLRFDNRIRVGVAVGDTATLETGALTRGRAGDWPWATRWSVVDASRRGSGIMKHGDGRELRFSRARLTLGANDEFMLVLDGQRRIEVTGVWRGDLETEPVRLQLRELLNQPVGGVGRAWIDEGASDRHRSFARIELDGWDDERGDAFTLSFEARPR